MPVDAIQQPVTRALPMEIRASLDLLFELIARERGILRSNAIGEARLVAALASYGALEPDRDHLTSIGASTDEIRAVVERHMPKRVTLLAAGRLNRVIRPLRRSADRIPTAPAADWWSRLGYRLTRSIGIQGMGSLFWSACDRVLRRFGRPQLSDRCRVAMLRTLVAARWSFAPSTLLILEYRRER